MKSEITKDRPSLRRFQEDLARRIAAAAGAAHAEVRLGVSCASRLWLLKLPDAGEIVAIPPLTPVPLTRPWFRGMASIRGILYAVIDLGQFLGEPPAAMGQHTRLLLVGRHYGMNSALMVERVLGLRNLRDFAVAERSQGAAWLGAEYTDAQGQRWCELEISVLVTASEFLDVAA